MALRTKSKNNIWLHGIRAKKRPSPVSQALGSRFMKMPLNLKIVVGLIVIAIISQIYSIVKFDSIDNPSSYIMNLFWIIIWIAIIRGFLKQSNISRRLAIGITLFGLLASIYAIYIYMTVPFSKPDDRTFAVFFSSAAILIQGYAIFALSSIKVVAYFTAPKSKSAQQTCVGDGEDHAAPNT